MHDPSNTPAPRLIFILGCTGSGKGSLGRELAIRIGGEIISIDSMKVYRRMDIGTAKPSAQTRAKVPHHLIDVVEPSEEFSAARYVELADAAIADIHARRKPILVVGGTPLYAKALTEGLFDGPGADPAVRDRLHEEARVDLDRAHERLQHVDPRAAAMIHRNDVRRIVRALEVHELTGRPISELQTQWDRQARYDCVFFGVRRSREDQSRRITERVERMMEAGLVDEVRALLAEPLPLSNTARKALGYAEIIEHLSGDGSLAAAVEKIKIHTRRLAKAQRTWFRRFPRMEWIDVAPEAIVETVAADFLERYASLCSPSPK